MSEKPPVGSVGWFDVTVENADALRDFYVDVAGWTPSPVDMGGYSDYTMARPDGQPVGGVCHARGTNAGLPPMWLIYIVVADIEASIAACRRHGGEVIAGPKSMGEARYCVIRDPAGAFCGLYQA